LTTASVSGHQQVSANCHNCGKAVADNYCAHCGQETRLHMPSLGEFLHEFVGHYVALEGKLWGTILRLLFRPGGLTNEYLAGRRRRYVEPLRIYLTVSILFFALMRLAGPTLYSTTGTAALPQRAPEAAAAVHTAGKAPVAESEDKDEEKNKVALALRLPPAVERWVPGVRHAAERFDALDNAARGKVLSESFFHYAPYAMFCLMPLFALYLKLLYLGTGRRYGEHLLFGLHTNAFAFVMFAAFVLMPDGFIKFLLFCWLLAYLPWAMQRVYRKGRWGTAWRWLLLLAAHVISLAFAIVIAAFIGLALAH
jgi:hypothetical protein